jgi:hypothetical protein
MALTPASSGDCAGLRRVELLWLTIVPLAVVAAAAVGMHLAGMVGSDTAAHVYKTELVRHHQSIVWDNDWYGGSYSIITYGPVYYWLAQYVPGAVIAVVSAGLLPLLFYLYMRRVYGVTGYLPTAVLTVVLAAYLENGQDPFLLALALTMLGLVLVAYRRPALAALPVGIGLFSNPLAFVVGAVFLIADFIARPPLRRTLLWFAAWFAPWLLVRAGVALLFDQRATYLDQAGQLAKYVSFALVGWGLARWSRDPQRRPLQVLFCVFAAACVLSFLVPHNPLGNNVGRFFFVFGLPLLLCVRRVRVPLVVVPLAVAVAYLQLNTSVSAFLRTSDFAAGRAPFFSSALAFAATHADPDYRIHVVAMWKHGEACFFPEAGLAITRGWYRQADALHNDLFYSHYTEAQYVAWLRAMGVEYVFVPNAKLDPWSVREPAILAGSPQFTVVFHDQHWTVYRLLAAEPLVTAVSVGGQAEVTALDHASLQIRVQSPGTYDVKVTWSPYWRVTAGDGTVSRGAGDFLVLQARAAGDYVLTIDAGLRAVLQRLF